jgi:predicted transposase/invertase (TIGR01784 family)
VLEANADKLKEVSEMKGGYTLEKYVEEAGLAAKWRNQGMEKGIMQGMEKGIMQGMEKGIMQGMEKGIIQVARAMLRKRLPLELIEESTGLSAEQIRRLQQQDAL